MTLRVLVVDDSLTVRMDLSEAFEHAGFTVTPCRDLSEARAALAANSFSLAVLDVLLPDGDGVDFLSELKSSPAMAALPVMLLSTEAQVQDRIRGMKTGADEYVGKPYDTGYVVARARELIRWRRGAAGADRRPMILVIDDSPTFRNEMQAALESAGYDVITAVSGEDGLHSAVLNRPAAVIVDNTLPGIDGTTVLRRMKEDAALRRTPCLLLTASENREQELVALEAGADSFIRKGEDMGIVLARLAAVLRTASTPSAVDSQSSIFGPKKILAVDDSQTYLEELANQLRQEGYDIVLANSGEEAIELAKVQAVDCILLDILMPGMSGHDTCRRIKTTSGLRDIPLLMLTGVDDSGTMIAAINAGADDYISKSGDFDVVRARVRAALRRKQFEDENRSVREQLLRKEMETAEARAQRELAETRATLLGELRESEARVNIAAESADLGVWYWDAVTNEHVWSDRYKALLGFGPEVTPKYETLLSAIHPEDRERMDRMVQEALSRHGELDVEYRAIWPDGSTHWIVAKGRCLYDDETGKSVRLTGVAMDVTERKHTQEALIRSEKLASVGRMAATMAHEINNPLAAVVNALFLVAGDATLSSETRANVELANRELERVVHMTRQTLGFYRENSRPGPVHLPNLVDELIGLYSRKLAYKRITVQKVYRGSTTVNGIAGELRQIVSNLLANSIDALASEGTIHVRTSCDVARTGFVRLTVADNGCGIQPEHLRSIFEPFFTTKKEVGTGLGLWVTRQIVEKHGGRIRVRSHLGRGTTFTVYLPATGATPAGKKTEDSDPQQAHSASA
jgi:two-component system, NtrC family, sensor kinase